MIMKRLEYMEPNAVRPRITEMVKQEMLKELRSIKCPVTGKTVRVVGIPQFGGE